MNNLSTRRQILMLLRTQGAQTAQQLAAQLQITSMGIRRHLTLLERDELVFVHAERRAVGRPAYLYALTDQGRETFPKNYDLLATQLLEVVRVNQGDEQITQIFAGRMDELYKHFAPRMNGKDLAERVQELAKIQEEGGYMTEWSEVKGGYLLKEQNCAIYRVACRFQAACRFEIELFRRLLGVDLERIEHQVSGALTCSYFIPDSHTPRVKTKSGTRKTARAKRRR
ncbi:MAG: hypothetical protein B6D41_05730 [Chloroflexi bacterium UTCFX4]|jgi:predicted ArsR family transcriptional regulator|nr:MAG: hypothetical protein B6D41_05730 [Chloroflexi bacterium UTCFX4]